ncbi:MAG: thioredoxin domain-containing protein [Deltaproteobacteria bacterium]|nr:thioredoxin domain-containing protein [Deltaproteobacteria bacterium]
MANRLLHEKSPYLKRHSDNPVDWYPWGEEAFERARREDKPVLLSSGYSSCHWCHVMERESFSDAEVGRLINDRFIAIKLDREERPEVDAFYMSAAYVLSGTGGWPLNIMLTPDKKPFFAVTYAPKDNVRGRVGIKTIVKEVYEVWKNSRANIVNATEKVDEALRSFFPEAVKLPPGKDVLDEACERMQSLFDKAHGGFGESPKFPVPHNTLFFLRYHKRSGSGPALDMACKTLKSMRRGAIFDQLGGGFHRYSTDREWRLPHFEKMLYDQAMHVMAYTEAYAVTGEESFRETAKEVLAYVERDMTHKEGGFYSALDADSEGREGAYYLWSKEELENVLGKKDAAFAMRLFGAEAEGNFIDEIEGKKNGKNVLIFDEGVLTDEESIERVAIIKKKLFKARLQRVRPFLDDKILTDWNGLMIAAFARASRSFVEPGYADTARRAADFIIEKLCVEGHVFHRWRDGEAAYRGTLTDYAFFTWGLIELYMATFDKKYLILARTLTLVMMERFQDRAGGAFFGCDGTESGLYMRQKDLYDGAAPSGNSVAAYNLVRLAYLCSDKSLLDAAALLGRAFCRSVEAAPQAYTMYLAALDMQLGPACIATVTGDINAVETRELVNALSRRYAPSVVVSHEQGEKMMRPFVRVCTLGACIGEAKSVEELLALLKKAGV